MQEKESYLKLQERIKSIRYQMFIIEQRLKLSAEGSSDMGNELEIQKASLLESLDKYEQELKNLSCEYEIKFYRVISNYGEWIESTISLKTCCEIDTFEHSWKPYLDDNCVENLILELIDRLWRYCPIEKIDIRRLD